MPTPPKVKVILNGIDLPTSNFSGTKDGKIVIRQEDKSGDKVFSYTNSLELTGQGRDIIFSEIINNANPFTASIPLTILDKCCNDENGDPFTLFEGHVTAQDVAYCEKDIDNPTGCNTMEVSSEDNSVEAQHLRCIKNTPVTLRESLDGLTTSNGEDEARPSVFYRYCIESRPFVLNALRLAFIILNIFIIVPMMYSLIPIILLFSGFTVTPADIVNFTNNWTKQLIGCGRKHKAPFVYSLIANVCKLCGLTLSSSLFEPGGPYYDLTYLNMPFTKGGNTTAKAEEKFKDLNFPGETLTQFLDLFATLNINYAVQGDVLVVERKDYFDNIWIDFSTRQDDIISLCFEFGSNGPKAGRYYEYTKDASDIGDEANRLWGGDVIDYNENSFNSILNGVERRTIPFGSARFSSDNFGSQIASIPPLPGIPIPKNVLLLSNGFTSIPKLLMWDTASDREDARVKKVPNPNGPRYIYNMDAWMSNQTGNIIAGQSSFYDRLLYIDDPREAGTVDRKFQLYSLVFSYNCEDLRSLEIGSQVKFIQNGTLIRGTVEEIEIDIFKRQILLTGKS
jgi:hypothetical protein